MAAFVIAPSRDGPLHILLEPGREKAVFLRWLQTLIALCPADEAVFFPMVIPAFLFLRECVPLNGGMPVAGGDQFKVRFQEELRLLIMQRLDRVGKQLPAPEGKAVRQDVIPALTSMVHFHAFIVFFHPFFVFPFIASIR